eukprot:CCRYP_000506-RA/>CCRYP_000506-RA protein AED:0.31 eAED:0.31 QI:0/0.33/0.5/1/0.66/0.5/4/0/840
MSSTISVLGNVDLLSYILHYAISHTKEVPAAAATGSHWNHVLNVNPKTSSSIWRNLCAAQEPDILRIYDLCAESKVCPHIGGGGWKILLRRARTSCFKLSGANRRLQRSFELVFKNEGILAFSNCCERCTYCYENCGNFTIRKRGITFFTFYLSGGNYEERHEHTAWVGYTNLEYLLDHWDAECDIIRRWCAVLDVTDYTIEKPPSEDRCIAVRFKDPGVLEDPSFEWDSDDMDMDYDDDSDGFDQDDVDENEEPEHDDVDETDALDQLEEDEDLCDNVDIFFGMESTRREDYLLLIEFVHKHIDFHDAELLAVLEMHGITIGTDCHFLPLPNDDNGSAASTKHRVPQSKRPFRILSFSWDSIGSKFSVCDNSLSTPEGKKCINLVTSLARCTLIRSVVELWGHGLQIDDCAKAIQLGNAFQRHKEGKHLSSSDNPMIAKSFEHRSWKITIHTLGSTFNREEQNHMRSKFAFLAFPGPVQMENPHDEYLFIREVELDEAGGAVYPRHSEKREIIPENDARPPLGCYFGRILGNATLGRNWRGSNRLEQYSLKKRLYLGPTSMDSELSLIMTNLAMVTEGSFAFDPFVGTGSILLTTALRGAYAFGTDIDLRVLRGRSKTENIESNFKQYGLPPPELVRCDNSMQHLPMFNAIVTDPPYGIRAGAKKTGSRREEVRPILDEHRYDHVAQTKPYAVSDVMSDLLNVAAMTLVMGGRLVYVIPSMLDFDENMDLPRHECLRLVSVCYQPLQTELGRRTVTMEKIKEYDNNKRDLYIEQTWINGPESAEKVANIRERLLEAAKKKPGYEEKAAIRKQKRKATKEAKKKAKRDAALDGDTSNGKN